MDGVSLSSDGAPPLPGSGRAAIVVAGVLVVLRFADLRAYAREGW